MVLLFFLKSEVLIAAWHVMNAGISSPAPPSLHDGSHGPGAPPAGFTPLDPGFPEMAARFWMFLRSLRPPAGGGPSATVRGHNWTSLDPQ